MIKKFILSFIWITVCVAQPSIASKPLFYGIVAENAPSHMLTQFRKAEMHAIQAAIRAPVKLMAFKSYKDELVAVKKNPNMLTFLYAKQVIIPSIAKLHNWVKIAEVLALDPDTHRYSNTHRAYLITAKNSTITKLDDLSNKTIVFYNTESASNYIAINQVLADNDVKNVHWVKAKNAEQAYGLVASGKADAVSSWQYLFSTSKLKDSFKIIYVINQLPNPVLYANSNHLSDDDIHKVKTALLHLGSKNHVNFTYG
jgi:ABC-type phosphate/phosphonate transport system substrate-binding protein